MNKKLKTIHGPRAVIALWLHSLRSGAYEQGQGLLQKDIGNGKVGYCCLGVLQHCQTGEVERSYSGDAAPYPSFGWLSERGIRFYRNVDYRAGVLIQDETSKRFDPSVYVPDHKDYFRVSELNDGDSFRGIRKYSFNEIADLIENHIQYTD